MKTVRLGINSLAPDKTVLVAPATKADAYWIGAAMHGLRGTFEHGMEADRIAIVGRHNFARDETINVRGLDGDIIATVLIKSISMVAPAKLTDADFQSMGYLNRADYMSDWGEIMGETVWLFRIERL